MNLVKIISSEINNLSNRIIKFLRLGNKDVQTSLEIMPFGVDSTAPKDMIALYSKTGEKGKTVIIGYINKHQLAAIGEHRTYSTNTAGDEVKFYIHQKNDGTCEIGGNSKHLTRFEELETGFNTLKTDFNNLVTNYNLHQHTSGAPGAPTTPGVPLANGVSSTASISGAKIEEIKTL